MRLVRNGRSRAAVAVQEPVRAAVYVRKSTTAGLDSDFTSLDNQRQRAEAYIQSQGWSLVPTTYSDAGISGGRLDRPALQQLLKDIENRLIDMVVVYKLDRFSRSLLDFLNIHRFLEKQGVSIVSVTEPIDTSTPMGRGFVNVLLSFAQIEREVAAERTRDKIRAARQLGRWTGGTPPLGYDTAPEGGRLVVNKDESEQVKAIFHLFVETPSLVGLAQELNRRGWRAKSWIAKTGRACGGTSWNRVTLHRLLTDPLYIGMQKLGDETFAGEHDAIVPKSLWNQVQRLLADCRSTGSAGARNGHEFLLRGLLRCTACDATMTPGWSRARGRLYRYYRCTHAEKNGHAACPVKSVQADKIEIFVLDQIRRIGADPELQAATFGQAVAQVRAQRRGLKAEGKRIERDLATARADIERLVGALSRTTGPAADAIAGELAKAQERVATLERRQREVDDEIATLAKQDVDREAVARALQDWDELWSVLVVAEQERVMRLLVERITYTDGELTIDWRMAGFGRLAAEVAP